MRTITAEKTLRSGYLQRGVNPGGYKSRTSCLQRRCGLSLVDHPDRIDWGLYLRSSIDFNMSGTKQLKSAIRSRNIGKLSELLEKMDLDVINGKKKGETALHFACRRKYNEAVDLLVTKVGVDVNVKNNLQKETPLHQAIKNNYGQAVSKILTNPQVDVNVQDIFGLTPLHLACDYNYIEIVSELLAIPGVDVNVQDNCGQTPLHTACENNYHQIVSELVTIPGVDVNVRDIDGITPAMLSARGRHEETLKLLLEDTSVDWDAKDEDGGGLELGNSEVEKQQLSQDCNIGQGIEKIEKLNKEMGDLEKKWKENLDIRKQKKRDLNERQNSEKKMMAKKHKDDEAALKKKHEEEETVLETSFVREDEVDQRHFAILRELRDELAQDFQKLTICLVQDTSGDHDKLEAARRSLECPVCMDLMRPPIRIWMCRLSHIICEPCKDELDKKEDNQGICQSCRTERVNLRALMAENFASTIFNE